MKTPFTGHKHSDGDTVFLTLHFLKPKPKAIRINDVELTMAPSAALIAKPRAQEPHCERSKDSEGVVSSS